MHFTPKHTFVVVIQAKEMYKAIFPSPHTVIKQLLAWGKFTCVVMLCTHPPNHERLFMQVVSQSMLYTQTHQTILVWLPFKLKKYTMSIYSPHMVIKQLLAWGKFTCVAMFGSLTHQTMAGYWCMLGPKSCNTLQPILVMLPFKLQKHTKPVCKPTHGH